MRYSREQGGKKPSGPATAGQIDFIVRHGLRTDLKVSKDNASKVISDFIKRRRTLPPTAKQEALLRQIGRWRGGMTRGEAFDTIASLFQDVR